MNGFNPGAMDRWITGNYGEDHPDNVDDRSDRERHEAICRAMERDRRRRSLGNGLCFECNIVLSKDAYSNGTCQQCGTDLDVWR